MSKASMELVGVPGKAEVIMQQANLCTLVRVVVIQYFWTAPTQTTDPYSRMGSARA